METSVSQSAGSGRDFPNRSRVPHGNPVLNVPVGVILTDPGVYSCSSLTVSSSESFSISVLPHSLQRKSPGSLLLFGGMEVVRKKAKDNPSASANLLSKIFFW